MGEENGRRKDDYELGEFIGSFKEWKESSEKWREETDAKLEKLVSFMEEISTPRKVVIWLIRAFAVAAVGGVVAGITSFMKGHIRFN